MKVEVEEFFRKIFKMLKLFQQKQNKDEQERKKIAGKSRQQPDEDDPSKRESPTVLLCSTVMEQINEFKVLYATIILKWAHGGGIIVLFTDAKPLCGMYLCQQEHIPVVSILCNPGIRAHHWKQMSEIAGYDLTPGSGTTLRKALKQNLAPYLEEFESISTAASKVRSPKVLC